MFYNTVNILRNKQIVLQQPTQQPNWQCYETSVEYFAADNLKAWSQEVMLEGKWRCPIRSDIFAVACIQRSDEL